MSKCYETVFVEFSMVSHNSVFFVTFVPSW
jgi:hypothetical protein